MTHTGEAHIKALVSTYCQTHRLDGDPVLLSWHGGQARTEATFRCGKRILTVWWWDTGRIELKGIEDAT